MFRVPAWLLENSNLKLSFPKQISGIEEKSLEHVRTWKIPYCSIFERFQNL